MAIYYDPQLNNYYEPAAGYTPPSTHQDVTATYKSPTQAIPADTLATPQTPITVPTPPPTVNPTESTTAGATETSKSLDQYIKELTPSATETSKAVDVKTEEINALLPSTTGRGSAQLEAEKAAQLPQQKQQLAQLNAEILSKVAEANKANAEYEKLITSLEGQTIPMSIILGQQGQVRRNMLVEANARSADIGLRVAIAQGISGNIQAAQENVNRSIELKYADIQDALTLKISQLQLLEGKLSREEMITKAALERKYQEEQRAMEEQKAQQKIVQNMAVEAAANGADNATIKAIGASADPITAATSYAQFIKTQNNLKNLSQYTVTSPYVLTAGGEVQNTQSGYGFTSELDFKQKTGMTLDQAVSRGLLKPLGQTKAEQQQGFENTIATENLRINRTQLGVSQYNAETSRLNAIQPKSSIVELSDGTKAIVTTDINGNVINQQPLTSGSTGQNELQIAKTLDSIATSSSLLTDRALNSAVGPIAAARGKITLPFGIKIPTTINSFTGAQQNFIATVEQLRSGLNLDTLIQAKAKGATFGALSNQELQLLASSASKIGTWAVTSKDGQVTGYNTDEKSFKNEVQTIINFSKLDALIKGADPAEVGVKIETDGSVTTVNWDGTVTELLKSQSGFNSAGNAKKSTSYLNTLGNITAYGSSAWQHGLDIDLTKGQSVKSPVGGKIIAVATNGDFGKQIKVKGDDGREYWFSHLDGYNVTAGQRIVAGDVLGKGGNSGNVIPMGGGDGSHLDLTVKENGKYLTPKTIAQLLKNKFV